ncbi:MAG: stage III sporulation protein AD [Clostridium perfringens]|nr:stage III sporulation protein AD [Clostridium perfringens]
MDAVIQVVAFSLVVMFLYLILKENKSTVASMILLISGVMICLFIFPYIKEIMTFVEEMTSSSGIDVVYVQIVMKIIAISYLATFCSVLCKDVGINSIATKVEFTAKIMILLLAMPIMKNVLDSILNIL